MKLTSPASLRSILPALAGVFALASATVLVADSPSRGDRNGRSGGGEQRSAARDDRSSGGPHRSYSYGPSYRGGRSGYYHGWNTSLAIGLDLLPFYGGMMVSDGGYWPSYYGYSQPVVYGYPVVTQSVVYSQPLVVEAPVAEMPPPVIIQVPNRTESAAAPTTPSATTGEIVKKDGQYFRKTPQGLVWIEAPAGSPVATLPKDAISVWYQGVEYFESHETYYRRTAEGYEVVPAPWRK